ncbi:MAG: hypothetical protein KGO96_07370 [Elusimicrobia bacterium]|nr:hypothetical protein [Elusimicrobiota bacterium]
MAQAQYLVSSLTANGAATGVITVASTMGFRKGALCYMNGTGLTSQEVRIMNIVNGTQMTVRLTSDPVGYGGSSMAAFTTAASSSITQPSQVVDDHDEAVVNQVLSTNGTLVPLRADKNGRIDDVGSNGTYSEVLVGTSATLLGGLANRKAISIFNNGPNTIYLGFDSSVTSSNGFPLSTNGEIDYKLSEETTVYAICSVAQISGGGTRIQEVA